MKRFYNAKLLFTLEIMEWLGIRQTPGKYERARRPVHL